MEIRANQGIKLRDWLNVDSCQVLDQDLSSKMKKKSEITPLRSSESHQIRHRKNNKIPNEELVKYMSNLPSYLEKGDDLREKALSFGVLDWRRLEKWQHNHKTQTFSPSTSNNSPYFSTDISSARSSLGHSCSSGENTEKKVEEIQDVKEKSDKLAKREQSLYRKYQSFSKSQEIKPKECDKEDIKVQSIRKKYSQNGKSIRQVEELERKGSDANSKCHEKGKHKASFDDFERNHRGGRKQLSSNTELASESCKSPLEDMPKKVVDILEPKVDIMQNNKLRKNSPSRMLGFGSNRYNRRSSSLDLSLGNVQAGTEIKIDLDYDGSTIPKLRNPSPSRKFSFRLDRFRQRSSSLDFSNDPNISHSKEGFDFCLENSINDKPNVGRKSQMSPLRRFLDPLLNPKAVNSNHSTDLSEKDSEKLNSKRSEPNVQALVQLSIKNGLPLYTFADDKTNGVLAATLKNVTSLKKGDSSWIYTFFNVNEVKKKNGWINKARKGETHGYVPSVIAQMRVSDKRHDSANKYSLREFVSFSVDVNEDEQQTSNFRPKDELAAIIVKFPKEAHFRKDKVKRGYNNVDDPIFSITTILPGGSHGLPSKGKPSPLIERWKSGGLCDCGGWDLGCRLKVLTSQTETNKRSFFSGSDQADDAVELFPQEEVVNDLPVFVLSPFKDNVYSVEFGSSLSFLQAFSICISVLNCRKPYDLSQLSKLFEEKTENTSMAGDAIKAPNPPLSPVGRV